jgi:hypothetical protein
VASRGRHDPGRLNAGSVQPNPDGTVEVTFKELRDPAGLQRALNAEGVAAYVRYTTYKVERINGVITAWPAVDCEPNGGVAEPWPVVKAVFPYPSARRDGPDTVIVIRPSAMPKGTAILITVAGGDNAQLRTAAGSLDVGDTIMGNDRPPVCTPAPTPGPFPTSSSA